MHVQIAAFDEFGNCANRSRRPRLGRIDFGDKWRQEQWASAIRAFCSVASPLFSAGRIARPLAGTFADKVTGAAPSAALART